MLTNCVVLTGVLRELHIWALNFSPSFLNRISLSHEIEKLTGKCASHGKIDKCVKDIRVNIKVNL